MGNVTRSAGKTCAACGSDAARGDKYCRVCDKLLAEDYQPLDAIRSSYRLQRKNLLLKQPAKNTALFAVRNNGVAETAWACVVYSMVPYLGILFVPLAVIAGGAGYFVSYRRPELGGRRLAAACVSLSFVMLAMQLFLWWLLYLAPTLAGRL